MSTATTPAPTQNNSLPFIITDPGFVKALSRWVHRMGMRMWELRSCDVEAESEGDGVGLRERRTEDLYVEASAVVATYNRLSRYGVS